MIIKSHTITLLYLAILLGVVNSALAEDELCNVTPAQVSQEVVKIVAEQGLSIVSINTDSLQSNYEQLPANTFELGEGLRFGTPLREYYVTLKSLEKYAEHHLFESILIPTTVWYVPMFITTHNYSYTLEINCWQGIFTVAAKFSSHTLSATMLKLMVAGVDLTQAKLINNPSHSDVGGYLLIMVTNGGETIAYPAHAYIGQYYYLKTVDSLGGYKASDIITEMLLEHLTTMNRRGNATISPDLKIHVPHAIFYYPTPEDIPTSLDLDFTFVPNPENRLLFEGSYKLSVD
jgi:hypothetical protein